MTQITALALWCSLFGWIIASSRPVRAAAAADKAATTVVVVNAWPREIQGIGLTPEKAKAEALQQTIPLLKKALAEMNPPLLFWVPDAEFIDRNLLEKPGRPGLDLPTDIEAAADVRAKVMLKTWIFPLRPLPLETLRQLDQKERLAQLSHDRRTWALQVALAALVACAATLGALYAGRRRSA